jgi:hypothetical protein
MTEMEAATEQQRLYLDDTQMNIWVDFKDAGRDDYAAASTIRRCCHCRQSSTSCEQECSEC